MDLFETRHRLILGDARHAGIPPVDLVVTSPPYPMVEMWDASFGAPASAALAAGDGPAAFAAMHEILDAVWARCAEALRPGGIACVNVGDATRTVGGAFALWPNAARTTQAMLRLGMTPLPTILWRKTTNAPTKFMGSGMLPAGAYVTLEHESILIFRKGGRREFRTAEEKRLRMESAFFWEERNRWFSDLWDLKGERQETSETERRTAAFPLELPWRLVQMFSVLGDTVLDPFAGTGTTAAAAAASGRNSVGVELDPGFHARTLARVAGIAAEANGRVEGRLAAHAAFMRGRAAKHRNEPHDVPVVTRQETQLRLHRVAAVRRQGDALVATHEPYAATRLRSSPSEKYSRGSASLPSRAVTAAVAGETR